MIHGLLTDLSSTFTYFKVRNLWWYFLIPVAVGLCLLFLAFHAGAALELFIEDRVHSILADQQIPNWLKYTLDSAIWIVARILSVTLMLLFGANLSIIILSPFLSWITERALAHVTGTETPFQLRLLLQNFIRSIRLVLKNLIWQIALLLTTLILSAIPLMGWLAAAVILFAANSWILGLSLFDYAMENARYSANDTIRIAGKNKMAVSLLGMCFMLVYAIPYLGVILSVLSVVYLSVTAVFMAVRLNLIPPPADLSKQ